MRETALSKSGILHHEAFGRKRKASYTLSKSLVCHLCYFPAILKEKVDTERNQISFKRKHHLYGCKMERSILPIELAIDHDVLYYGATDDLEILRVYKNWHVDQILKYEEEVTLLYLRNNVKNIQIGGQN